MSSPNQSTDSLPNAVPPTTPSSASNALAVYKLVTATLFFSSFQQTLVSSNGISYFSFFFSTVITIATVLAVGFRNSASSQRRWRNGTIAGILINVCASTAALCSDGDKEVAVSATVMHLGTLFLTAANVYSRRRSRDTTPLSLMTHIGSTWQVMVMLITHVSFLRSSLDRNALSFRIATASVAPALLSHLSIIWLRETGYGCRFLEFNLITTNAERCWFFLNVYALLLTVSVIFSAALPLLKEITIVIAFIGIAMFCAMTYILTVPQEERARVLSSNV